MKMIKVSEGHYTAPSGYQIVSKIDDTIRTDSIWLGKNDTIENYKLEEEVQEDGGRDIEQPNNQ